MNKHNITILSILAIIITTVLGNPFAQGDTKLSKKSPTELPCEINSKFDARAVPWKHFGWQNHSIIQYRDHDSWREIPAYLYFIGGEWKYNNSQMPYLVYMPERNQILLAASVDKPEINAMAVFSSDMGRTWTKPQWIHTDESGNPNLGAATQLTYLGNGKLIIGTESQYWISRDFGKSWDMHSNVPKGSKGQVLYQWDPMLVSVDKGNKTVQLLETRYYQNGTFDTIDYFSQACVRYSNDEGKSWDSEIVVPQWQGINEVVLCRAKNNNIVAACRTDNQKEFLGKNCDQYSGLATSISTDGGQTWSELNHLYLWGRHHPHMLTMPNGDIVMTYVVRKGYDDDELGRLRFGIEAVVSRDNGKTWDIEHRYVLASNFSILKGDRDCWGSPQSTTNVLLPDGYILTAFGTGVRNTPEQDLWLMDVALIKWKPNGKK